MTVPPELATADLMRLWNILPEARVVGGAVRDHLAGRPLADIDLATPRRPDEVTRVLSAAAIRVIPTGIEHGTVTALVDGHPFEVTTLRRDVETDGRHAVVAFTDDWRDDAARRDFTFNAMSMDRAGTIHDYFGGRADLAAGVVRFVRDAPTRIAEDFLRVPRFFRFFARYGVREPDPTLRAALAASADRLGDLSAERVWSELRRLLSAPADSPAPGPPPAAGGANAGQEGGPRRPSLARAVDLMAELGVLRAIVGVPAVTARFRRLMASGAPADPLLRLAALTDEPSERLGQRFRLSGRERLILDALRADLPAAPDPAARIRLWLHRHPDENLFLLWTWLHDEPEPRRLMLAAPIVPPVFPVQGRDLIPLGWQPGPDLGRALARLRDCWLAGGCVATRDELVRLLAG